MLFVLFLLLESLCVSTSSKAPFSESQLKSGCGFVTKRKTIEKDYVSTPLLHKDSSQHDASWCNSSWAWTNEFRWVDQ